MAYEAETGLICQNVITVRWAKWVGCDDADGKIPRKMNVK